MMKQVIATFLLIVIFPILGYGETPPYGEKSLSKIYGLRDQDSLQKIIHETEPVNPSDRENLKRLGIAYHNLGFLKVKGSPDKAVEYLEKANQLSPTDDEVLAYLGSAKTMIARDSWNVVTKVSRANQGIRIMDKAVRRSPDNFPIRMVRANNSLNLPKMFNRRPIAKEDFLHLEALILKAPFEIDADVRAEIFYQLGLLYKEENESRSSEYFRKAVALSPDSKWGMEAKKEL